MDKNKMARCVDHPGTNTTKQTRVESDRDVVDRPLSDDDFKCKLTMPLDCWRQACIDAIHTHPAMGPDSTCVIAPGFDTWDWQDMYDQGLSVYDVFAEADAKFNVYGW